MKCLKLNNEVKRVSDESVQGMLKRGWVLCPKHEWRDKKAKNVKNAQTDEVETKVSVQVQAPNEDAKAGPAPKKSYKDKVKKRKVEDLTLPA